MKNKKGSLTLALIAVIFIALVLLIIMGIMVYSFDLVSQSFNSIDFTLGNVSFNDSYQETLGTGVNSMRTTVPQIISGGTLFGMIIILIFLGYLFGSTEKLWIVLDIGVIVVAEVIVVIVAESFSTFVNSSPEFLAIYSTTLLTSATFVLRMPVMLPIIGAVLMLATYVFNKKLNQGGSDVPGF